MTLETVRAGAAGTWLLGDLTVNRIGFGAMRLTGSAAFHRGVPHDRSQVIGVLRRAVELGVNHVDTAAFYFSRLRSANELINSALAPYPDDLVIATKVGPARDASGEWAAPARPDQLRGQVEENLRQLGRDHLDVVNLRLMGQDSISEHFGALTELRDAGLVRHLGISGARPTHLAQAQAIAPVVCVQNRYGIDARAGAEMLQTCAAQGIAFVPFFSIAGEGREAGAVRAEREQILTVARAHRVSPAQVRLAWTLRQGKHVLAIPGTGDPDHLIDNLAAGSLHLTEEDLELLDSIDCTAP
ncbi:aldo/keto reductase [Streptomyces cellostaticus]|uniref:Aldo/keto reductase n=1 Tax=Streptomyces cellostaticus TaxID=67285 RepID=A0A101NTH8_9ACTN|nr:oxidoreductase [Streptomyces cellostaticus]KUM98971.1 aldo/keto reductase [Streptomyces cellostaticus]